MFTRSYAQFTMASKSHNKSSIASTPPVATVSVKLPEFYQANPASWFLHAEAQFGIHGIISDETKYWHVLSDLATKTPARATRVIYTA